MKEKLVSIIVPVYNSEKTLNRCIDSLIAQTYSNIEIIIINDGSTDKSGKICEEYVQKDYRIKLINQQNRGVSVARNKGLESSNGEFICFVDSDDYVSEKFVENLYITIVENDVDLAICNMNIVNSKRSYTKDFFGADIKSNIALPKEKYYTNIDKFGGFVWNKMFLKKYMDNLLFDEHIYYCEDELFVVNYTQRCNKLACLDEALYFYCITESSASSLKNWNGKKITILDAKRKILHILEKYDFKVYKNYYLKYFYALNDIYHRYSKDIVDKKELQDKYKRIIKSNDCTTKEKINTIIRFRFFRFYNLSRNVFHLLKG